MVCVQGLGEVAWGPDAAREEPGSHCRLSPRPELNSCKVAPTSAAVLGAAAEDVLAGDPWVHASCSHLEHLRGPQKH